MKLHHLCIQTNCYDESMHFYVNCMKMQSIKESKNFHGRNYNTRLQADDYMIELQTPKQSSNLSDKTESGTGVVHVCVYVDSLKDAYDSLISTGFTDFKINEGKIIYQVCGGSLFKLYASEGTIWEFRNSLVC